MARTDDWPAIPVDAWEPTRDTLHLYTQVVGKVRMVNEPLENHWWNVPLYVTARGLTTGLMPHPTGPAFQIDLDLCAHRLDVVAVDGTADGFALEPRSVADFYTLLMGTLDGLGVGTRIWPMPVEIAGAIPFDQDRTHDAYDADAVHRFWRALVSMEQVFKVFRTGFLGKASPVHLFWGAIDLAYTRFSGRTAPPHPGGAPNCGPPVMHEAYSREVSSCGYWPGGPAAEGCFYAYAYPEPDGYRAHAVEPAAARWDDLLGEFVLPYEAVRTSPDPAAALGAFLQSTYVAAAETGRWDRALLERTGDDPGHPDSPPHAAKEAHHG